MAMDRWNDNSNRSHEATYFDIKHILSESTAIWYKEAGKGRK